MKKKLLILSGAGLSKESGIDTFRCADGVYTKNISLESLLTIEGWYKNNDIVLALHTALFNQTINAEPNDAHKNLVKLEDQYDISIITQNVDDLHERAGSNVDNIYHMHGKIREYILDGNKIKQIEGNEYLTAEQVEKEDVRPNVVWFGENVKYGEVFYEKLEEADIIVVIGCSLQVYPFASCQEWFLDKRKQVYIINPDHKFQEKKLPNVTYIKDVATKGTEILLELLK